MISKHQYDLAKRIVKQRGSCDGIKCQGDHCMFSGYSSVVAGANCTGTGVEYVIAECEKIIKLFELLTKMKELLQ